ncbi:Glycoside hydrolase, family 18, catalytic domain protein [Niveomyces insectorum RCEF 264]|uniref:chitinase n=1 Tax=Niveomyces insectorum RCEF 264 TaxID=1081102 RepID=A0A167WAR9_9HYPO|nr:Glycoside hydrolase, family 18, catalytic domain protein [Niveomyces insectorum RCEF 264]
MSRPPPLVNAVYYPSWRIYKDITPSSLPLDKISTVFYAFAIFSTNTPTPKSPSAPPAAASPPSPPPSATTRTSAPCCPSAADVAALSVLDVAGLAALVDHVNLMGYDLAGPWSAVAGHHAQLFAASSTVTGAADNRTVSCQTGLRYLLGRGLPPERILLGIPAYARVFYGARGPGDTFTNGESSGGCGGGGADEEANAPTEIDYRDVPADWKRRVHVDRTRVAAWLVVDDDDDDDNVGGHKFVSLDVPETVRAKAAFARSTGLGGLFFWTGAGDAVGDDSLVVAGFDGLHGQ